jgi:queuine/archaeosine tRNA-ribosyltransferase
VETRCSPLLPLPSHRTTPNFSDRFIPTVWLGHNLRNAVLFSSHPSLSVAPMLVSLGDAFLRPSYMPRFFTTRIREELGMTGPLMVDSGGYTLLSNPQLRWSIKQVERAYSELPVDILVSLDYPPSPFDDARTRTYRRKRTLTNFSFLYNALPKDKLMPVVHGHSLREIEVACDGVKHICRNPKHIGIGGIVPLICSGGCIKRFRFRRVDGTDGDKSFLVYDALTLVRREFPASRVHVFGTGSAVTAISVLALGADSVDSFSWRRAASYGAILLPGRSERFPLSDPSRVRSRPVIGQLDLSLLEACRCPSCAETANVQARLLLLSRCYKQRAIHNAWTILAEVESFTLALHRNELGRFLRHRLSPRHRFYHPVIERLRLLGHNDSAPQTPYRATFGHPSSSS